MRAASAASTRDILPRRSGSSKRRRRMSNRGPRICSSTASPG